MSLLAAVVVATLNAAPPSPLDRLPKLLLRPAGVIQSGWEWVKEEPAPTEQERRLAERRLDVAVCSDAIDLRPVLPSLPGGSPYRLRDLVRQRHVARPEMVALLLRAGALLERELPGARITVGDIAQTGCGQIRYGTIVDIVPREEAEGLLREATVEFGALTQRRLQDPADYLDEFPRFDETDGPITAEWRATGALPDGRVRVELRRFDLPVHVGDLSFGRLISRCAERFGGKNATWDTVEHRGQRLKRGTFLSPTEGLFAEVVLRPGSKRWTGRADAILRVREAVIDSGKPTSLKFEERYDFDLDGEAGVTVWRSLLEYEAHHASHLSGLDADLSYVTADNRSHFAPDAALLDATRTWRWLRILARAAAELEIPLQHLFVDRSIYRALKRVPEARKSDPAWKRIHLAPGHDSHVHVRIGTNTRFTGKALNEILELTTRPRRPSSR